MEVIEMMAEIISDNAVTPHKGANELLNLRYPCKDCKGSGLGQYDNNCPTCNGTGHHLDKDGKPMKVLAVLARNGQILE